MSSIKIVITFQEKRNRFVPDTKEALLRKQDIRVSGC